MKWHFYQQFFFLFIHFNTSSTPYACTNSYNEYMTSLTRKNFHVKPPVKCDVNINQLSFWNETDLGQSCLILDVCTFKLLGGWRWQDQGKYKAGPQFMPRMNRCHSYAGFVSGDMIVNRPKETYVWRTWIWRKWQPLTCSIGSHLRGSSCQCVLYIESDKLLWKTQNRYCHNMIRIVHFSCQYPNWPVCCDVDNWLFIFPKFTLLSCFFSQAKVFTLANKAVSAPLKWEQ